MEKIGETLKDARDKKSITIDQVQKQTRIHSTVLKALEEGRCDSMLTPTYVRSFLKKYAEYLGLDARQVLNEYAKLRPAQPASSLALANKEPRAPSIDLPKFFLLVRRALVAAIVIALVIFVGSKAIGLLKRAKAARPAPASKKSATVTRQAPAPAKKKTAPKARLPESEAKQIAPKPASVQKEPAAKVQTTVKAASTAVIPKGTPLKLLIKVNQTVMVKVSTDGKLLFSRVLYRGAVESFTAEERINIYVAKAEAIELFLNGRSLGSPGRGLIKNIEITRNGLKLK